MTREVGCPKERYFFFNGLAGLVKSLEGKCTTIDLRNDCSVTGEISLVDGCMNVTMCDVVLVDPSGNRRYLEDFFVHHRSLRYVHVPKEYPIKDLIQGQLDKMTRKKPKEKKVRTFKLKRAMIKQMEVVAEIEENRKKEEGLK